MDFWILVDPSKFPVWEHIDLGQDMYILQGHFVQPATTLTLDACFNPALFLAFSFPIAELYPLIYISRGPVAEAPPAELPLIVLRANGVSLSVGQGF